MKSAKILPLNYLGYTVRTLITVCTCVAYTSIGCPYSNSFHSYNLRGGVHFPLLGNYLPLGCLKT